MGKICIELGGDFMDKVRKMREQKRWTQEQLAVHSGVPQSTISRIENSNTKKGVPIFTLRKIANALGCTVADLLEEEEEPKPA
jgi:transcriptional regulator with XRE-family HTH domain